MRLSGSSVKLDTWLFLHVSMTLLSYMSIVYTCVVPHLLMFTHQHESIELHLGVCGVPQNF